VEAVIVNVSLVHDRRDFSQGGITESILVQEAFKGTPALVVTEFDTSHVEGRATELFRCLEILRERELRFTIDEAPD